MRQRTGKKKDPLKYFQFGEGNFLRAFVDYMIDIVQMNQESLMEISFW